MSEPESNARCPRCGGAFHCGAQDRACPCATVNLSDATRQRLRARYQGCLCVACLRACAHDDAPAATDGSASAARRATLRRMGLWGSAAVVGPIGVGLAGCGGSGGSQAATPAPVVATPGGGPSLGAHSLVFHRDGVNAAPIASAAMATQAGGSTLLACVGRGIAADFGPPSDNQGNASWLPLGGPHAYTLWPQSGTALYGVRAARGGNGHVVSNGKPHPTDETTLSVVEVRGGGTIADVQWNEALVGTPITSLEVTTSAPAVLVAWWWGDAGAAGQKTAVPGQGFVVIDSVLDEGALVQCAVAARAVTAPGRYSVTWSATPPQGAQLWLVAVQAG